MLGRLVPRPFVHFLVPPARPEHAPPVQRHLYRLLLLNPHTRSSAATLSVSPSLTLNLSHSSPRLLCYCAWLQLCFFLNNHACNPHCAVIDLRTLTVDRPTTTGGGPSPRFGCSLFCYGGKVWRPQDTTPISDTHTHTHTRAHTDTHTETHTPACYPAYLGHAQRWCPPPSSCAVLSHLPLRPHRPHRPQFLPLPPPPALLRPQLWVVGGGNGSDLARSGVDLFDVWTLDLKSWEWAEVKPANEPHDRK